MKIRSVPKFLKIVRILAHQGAAGREIDAARASGDAVKEREAIGRRFSAWAADTARAAGLTVIVEGRENIPADDGFVVISNHQSYGDVPALGIAFYGRQLGFIAKSDFEKVPLLGTWVRRVRGVFLHRGNPREALKDIKAGSDLVKQGYNIAIFPEGTRSRGPVMGSFKHGAFRIATKPKAVIVPVLIDGTYHVYEEHDAIRPAECTVRILPPVDTAALSRQGIVTLEDQVENALRELLRERYPEAYAEADAKAQAEADANAQAEASGGTDEDPTA